MRDEPRNRRTRADRAVHARNEREPQIGKTEGTGVGVKDAVMIAHGGTRKVPPGSGATFRAVSRLEAEPGVHPHGAP